MLPVAPMGQAVLCSHIFSECVHMLNIIIVVSGQQCDRLILDYMDSVILETDVML